MSGFLPLQVGRSYRTRGGNIARIRQEHLVAKFTPNEAQRLSGEWYRAVPNQMYGFIEEVEGGKRKTKGTDTSVWYKDSGRVLKDWWACGKDFYASGGTKSPEYRDWQARGEPFMDCEDDIVEEINNHDLPR